MTEDTIVWKKCSRQHVDSHCSTRAVQEIVWWRIL